MPDAWTLSCAVCPVSCVWLAGCVVIVGATAGAGVGDGEGEGGAGDGVGVGVGDGDGAAVGVGSAGAAGVACGAAVLGAVGASCAQAPATMRAATATISLGIDDRMGIGPQASNLHATRPDEIAPAAGRASDPDGVICRAGLQDWRSGFVRRRSRCRCAANRLGLAYD